MGSGVRIGFVRVRGLPTRSQAAAGLLPGDILSRLPWNRTTFLSGAWTALGGKGLEWTPDEGQLHNRLVLRTGFSHTQADSGYSPSQMTICRPYIIV